MRILMIACVPFYEERGTPISIFERLKSLSEFCDRVDVVTYHLGKDIDLKNITVVRIPDLKFVKQVPVGPSVVKLVLDIIIAVKVLLMLFKRDYDLIYSNEEGAVIGAFYSKLFNAPHVYDFHSSLPDVIENFGQKRFLIFKGVFSALERIIINYSSAIITISPLLTQYVKSINSNIPVATVENAKEFMSIDSVSIEQMENVKNQYSINHDSKLVIYTGTFELYQGLDLLLVSAQLVNKSNKDVVFMLVGGNKKQVEYYKKKSLALGIENSVIITGKKPQEFIHLLYNIADVLVSPRIRGMNPPLKIYSYLLSGNPIVATNIPAHTQILNSTVACLVEPEPEDLASGILSTLDDAAYSNSIAQNAKNYYHNKYGQNTEVDELKRMLFFATNRVLD